MRVHIFAVALLFSSALSLDGHELLTMAVSPAQSFAPTNLTIRVRVEPDAGNRALEVVADSGEYYRSSRIPLDGSEAPHTISLEIRNLPGGSYDVRGALINSAGRERAAVHRQVTVLGPAGSDAECRRGSAHDSPGRTSLGWRIADEPACGARVRSVSACRF